MTGHDFRGEASTSFTAGWPHEHIELRSANEEWDDTSAACNHAPYLKPRAAMMQAWVNHLLAVAFSGLSQTIFENERAVSIHAYDLGYGCIAQDIE